MLSCRWTGPSHLAEPLPLDSLREIGEIRRPTGLDIECQDRRTGMRCRIQNPTGSAAQRSAVPRGPSSGLGWSIAQRRPVTPTRTTSWLDTPNDAFDGLKPLEVIERGEIDRLWNMIFYLESGVTS